VGCVCYVIFTCARLVQATERDTSTFQQGHRSPQHVQPVPLMRLKDVDDSDDVIVIRRSVCRTGDMRVQNGKPMKPGADNGLVGLP
jgi:hypothetical protein